MKAISESLKAGKYDKAAEQLEKIDPKNLDRKQRDAVAKNLKKFKKDLGEGQQGELSQAAQEMEEGLENETSRSARAANAKPQESAKNKASRRASHNASLSTDRLSQCKSNCQNPGQCAGNKVPSLIRRPIKQAPVRLEKLLAKKRPASIPIASAMISPVSKATAHRNAKPAPPRRPAGFDSYLLAEVFRVSQANGGSPGLRATSLRPSRNRPQILRIHFAPPRVVRLLRSRTPEWLPPGSGGKQNEWSFDSQSLARNQTRSADFGEIGLASTQNVHCALRSIPSRGFEMSEGSRDEPIEPGFADCYCGRVAGGATAAARLDVRMQQLKLRCSKKGQRSRLPTAGCPTMLAGKSRNVKSCW